MTTYPPFVLSLVLVGCIADPRPAVDPEEQRAGEDAAPALDGRVDATARDASVPDLSPPEDDRLDGSTPDAALPDARPACADPTWSIVGEVALPSTPRDLDLRADTLYALLPQEGLAIIDVAEPDAPVALGVHAVLGAQALALSRDASWAVVAAVGDGVRVLDLSDARAPREIGAFDLVGAAGAEYAQDIVLAGTTAYVAAGAQGVWRVDVDDPRRPRGAASCCGAGGHPLSGPRGIALVEGGLAVADTDEGLVMIAIDGDRLTHVSSTALPVEAHKVRVLGGVVYVLLGGGQLAASQGASVDADGPTRTIELPAPAADVALVDGRLFVGTEAGIWALDGEATEEVLAVERVSRLLPHGDRLYIGVEGGLLVAERGCR